MNSKVYWQVKYLKWQLLRHICTLIITRSQIFYKQFQIRTQDTYARVPWRNINFSETFSTLKSAKCRALENLLSVRNELKELIGHVRRQCCFQPCTRFEGSDSFRKTHDFVELNRVFYSVSESAIVKAIPISTALCGHIGIESEIEFQDLQMHISKKPFWKCRSWRL